MSNKNLTNIPEFVFDLAPLQNLYVFILLKINNLFNIYFINVNKINI